MTGKSQPSERASSALLYILKKGVTLSTLWVGSKIFAIVGPFFSPIGTMCSACSPSEGRSSFQKFFPWALLFFFFLKQQKKKTGRKVKDRCNFDWALKKKGGKHFSSLSWFCQHNLKRKARVKTYRGKIGIIKIKGVAFLCVFCPVALFLFFWKCTWKNFFFFTQCKGESWFDKFMVQIFWCICQKALFCKFWRYNGHLLWFLFSLSIELWRFLN